MPPKKQPAKSSATLSQAQEEEMSSALIAKLLAQDAMNDGGGNYYAEYSNDTRHYDSYQGRAEDQDGNYEDDESDDYAPKRQGKSKKVKAKKSECKSYTIQGSKN
jgi:protein MYSM1